MYRTSCTGRRSFSAVGGILISGETNGETNAIPPIGEVGNAQLAAPNTQVLLSAREMALLPPAGVLPTLSVSRHLKVPVSSTQAIAGGMTTKFATFSHALLVGCRLRTARSY